MLVGLDGRKGVDLVDGALLEFGNLSKLLGLDDLDGHLLLGLDVDALIDLPIDSLADERLQRIVLDDFPHSTYSNMN